MVAGPNYEIFDIMSGWPGSVHDARVFQNSGIFKKGTTGKLFPNWPLDMNGTNVPIFLIGDAAYPLLPWLMKPFPGTDLDEQTYLFNKALSTARMPVENTFGRLKGRWRCLLKRNDTSISNLITIIGCCATLHNICELHRDHFPQEWLDAVEEANIQYRQPLTGNTAPVQYDTSASDIRDTLHDYITSNN